MEDYMFAVIDLNVGDIFDLSICDDFVDNVANF